MDLFGAILTPISYKNISEPHDHTLTNAIYLSSFFNSKPHLIALKAAVPKIKNALTEIDHVKSQVIIHGSGGNLFQDILTTIKHNSISLLLLGTNQSTFLKANNHVTLEQQIIQRINIPIISCPTKLDLNRNPLESLLVPMSGEIRMNAALTIALRIAFQLNVPVDLIHVTSRSSECKDTSLVGHLSDHFYHEYPSLIERLISEGSPFSGLRERRLIREFWHSWGDQANEILKHAAKKTAGLIVLEWKGTLHRGHATILKSILNNCNRPILLVRESGQGASQLKVGRDFRAA